ncbi:pyridoxamine 5'-phosphate oxidase [Nakamurella sp.]|uniref:pyridoxamine 5'-phosphate oxidase n=1 Tax=Nakamurella sp. TaxID=1869182 RepID=UPI003782FA61
MSIKVEPDDLPRVLGDFDAGYLLTVDPVGSPARVKVVSVRPSLADGRLVITRPGRGSIANARANPAVTVVWPPREPGGMSLIVDGSAECEGEDLRVTPASGVLHKPA